MQYSVVKVTCNSFQRNRVAVQAHVFRVMHKKWDISTFRKCLLNHGLIGADPKVGSIEDQELIFFVIVQLC